LLKSEIQEIEKTDFDLDLLGFDNSFLNDLLSDDDLQQLEEDEVPEVQENTVSVLGDVWNLGNHVLHCNDSSIDLFNCNETSIVFTDPPYQLDQDVIVDILKGTNAKDFVLIATFKQLIDICNNDFFKFHFDFVIDAKIPKSFMNKKQPYYTHQNGVYLTTDGNTKFNCDNAKGIRSGVDTGYWHTIIESPRSTKNEHGHAKNAQGMIDVICAFEFDELVDPFAGSGTSLIVAENLKKKWEGCEIDPKYCDVIIRRWQNLTGKEAVLKSNGKTFREVENAS